MFLTAGCIDVFHPMVSFSSCGVSLKGRYIRAADAVDWTQLQDAGYEICVLSPHTTKRKINLLTYTPPNKVVYVLGSESTGASESIVSLADKILSIPMNPKVESLSVASAASVLCYYHLWTTKYK